MSAALVSSVLAASLLGSLHCAAMCGGFVVAASHGAPARRRLVLPLVYNGGRLISYLVLGALSGVMGRAVDLAGNAAGVGGSAAVVAGFTMMAVAIVAMLRQHGVAARSPAFVRAVSDHVAVWFRALHARPPGQRALLFGLLSALLPCGWLYGFAVAAAATGSAKWGALVMAAFWAGNFPLLLGLGALLDGVFQRLRPHVPFASALVMLALGLFTIVERANVPALALAPLRPAAGVQAGTMPADCPFHRHGAAHE